jgi:CheY-like chemotaxis protein
VFSMISPLQVVCRTRRTAEELRQFCDTRLNSGAITAGEFGALLTAHVGRHKGKMAMVDTNILLVDDDQDTCASMSDIFSDLGYTVDVANDGPGALELSGLNQYRLALLDYKMPGMDGLELCRRLKKSQPRVVVALITAFASVATAGAATEAGVRYSLLKPVNFSVLMPLVAQAVGSG